MGEIRHADEWASLYTFLAECLKHPDEQFYEDVETGRFEMELTELAESLDLDLPAPPDTVELLPETTAALDSEYISLFEAMETPYAPPIESVYKEWHDGQGSDGLLNGPSAVEMRARYEALDVSPPDAYPADHLALLLEYAAVVVRSGNRDAYESFVRDHFDWLVAFRTLVDDAAASAPFHTYCATLVCDCLEAVRRREGVAGPTDEEVDAMLERASAKTTTRKHDTSHDSIRPSET
ncbi:component of anaerobic dehydrogenase [Natronobacterium gregoryi SP2]|uniref:Component of anaerobic dehydrogenase n=1 Tax=Natronobacterium gregoryi (strain ATCC 43098 / DSM 3393 / CCM 3738 / CIP 104747 / IAM 13177 / JCM 8860 / NBRC 102187 / NCIMB 2189 / SP2) TaxID=797304 RepID=L9Y4K3_NATGS|nr:component of anaerobic dehydrogenase [Natronobacterium gregoryi SP2]